MFVVRLVLFLNNAIGSSRSTILQPDALPEANLSILVDHQGETQRRILGWGSRPSETLNGML